MKNETPNFDILENIKKYLKENLKIVGNGVSSDTYCGAHIDIELILENEVISSETIFLD